MNTWKITNQSSSLNCVLFIFEFHNYKWFFVTLQLSFLLKGVVFHFWVRVATQFSEFEGRCLSLTRNSYCVQRLEHHSQTIWRRPVRGLSLFWFYLVSSAYDNRHVLSYLFWDSELRDIHDLPQSLSQHLRGALIGVLVTVPVAVIKHQD